MEREGRSGSWSRRLTSQWREVRERRTELHPVPVMEVGGSNLSRARVPRAVDAAAALYAVFWVLGFLTVIVVPVVVAVVGHLTTTSPSADPVPVGEQGEP